MPQPRKPPALRPGDAIRVLSLASPVEKCLVEKGRAELESLGYSVMLTINAVLARDGYFAGSTAARLAALKSALVEPQSRAIFCSRGGYGSNYLLDRFERRSRVAKNSARPQRYHLAADLSLAKVWLGHISRPHGRVRIRQRTRARPMDMIATACCMRSLKPAKVGPSISMANPWLPAQPRALLLGGCLTLVQTSLGTPWELDTRGAILVIEDRGMKPYQVDRALMHLKQAGKFDSVAGIMLGDFPECEAPAAIRAGKKCRATHSGRPGRSGGLGRCRRTYGSADAHAAFRRSRAS